MTASGQKPSSRSMIQNSAPGSGDLVPVLAILGAVLLWGSSFSAMRWVLKDLDPMSVMFCRLLTAFICLIPFYHRLIPKTYRTGDWKILVPTVLFQPCLYFLFESNALRYTTSSQAGIIAACMPLMVAVAAWFFLSETITVKTIIGLFLSIAGVVALTVFQDDTGVASNPVLGNFLEFGAMASATANTILIKQLTSRYSPWTLTGMQVIAGLLFFLPGLSGVLQSSPDVWSMRTILLLLFLGSFVSLGAFAFFNWGISRVEASRASVFINLIPVTAIILGWLFLNEVLNAIQSIAAVVVILGVLYSTRK